LTESTLNRSVTENKLKTKTGWRATRSGPGVGRLTRSHFAKLVANQAPETAPACGPLQAIRHLKVGANVQGRIVETSPMSPTGVSGVQTPKSDCCDLIRLTAGIA